MSSKTVEQVSDEELEPDDSERERIDDEIGREILSIQEENWGSVDDLSEESNVKTTFKIIGHKYITHTLNYEDEEMLHELSTQEAKQQDGEAQYADVTAPNRDQVVPNDFEEGFIDFPRPDTERVDACTNCGGNGRNRCSKCNGGGRNSCGWCGGSGTNSDNTKRCGSCGGSGSKVCGKCDGTGSVACSTCKTTGQTWKMEFVRREFTPETTTEIDAPGIPDGYVENAEGEYVATEEMEPQENEIRREVEERDVEVEKVDYVYDNSDYEIYRVEGDVKAKSYPMNQARKWAPYVGAAVIVLLVALWYFVL